MTDQEYSTDPFYSLGKRLQSEEPQRKTINELHKNARDKASEAGVRQVSSKRRFKTKNSSYGSRNRTVKNANQGWTPNTVVSNPYKARTQNRKLDELVAERARNL